MITGLLTTLATVVTGVAAGAGKLGKVVLGQTLNQGSIARKTLPARIEPLTLIDAGLEFNDRIDATLETCINLQMSLYSQAVSLTDTTVNNTQIIERLEALNYTNNSNKLSRMVSSGLGLESIDIGSGNLSEFIDVEGDKFAIPDYSELWSMESMRKGNTVRPNGTIEPGLEDSKKLTTHAGKGVTESFKDAPQLAFGKIFNVEFKTDGEVFTIPITMRLATTLVSADVLTGAMVNRFKSEQTALERKVKWKTGGITNILDLILCRDIVRDSYKSMIRDKDGIYSKLSPNRVSDLSKALINGRVSVAEASNILVISQSTADIIEAKMGGKFSQEAFRQRMLEATGIMILAIIDPVHDYVTFYIESIANGQKVSGRNLESSKKKGGPDMNDLLTSLLTGRGQLSF